MSTVGSSLFLLLFTVLLAGNLACQTYISIKVFNDFHLGAGIWGGTQAFIHGWKQANKLRIKEIMILWSILLTLFLILMVTVGAIFTIYGPPATPLEIPALSLFGAN
jgi:hypothetical protein